MSSREPAPRSSTRRRPAGTRGHGTHDAHTWAPGTGARTDACGRRKAEPLRQHREQGHRDFPCKHSYRRVISPSCLPLLSRHRDVRRWWKANSNSAQRGQCSRIPIRTEHTTDEGLFVGKGSTACSGGRPGVPLPGASPQRCRGRREPLLPPGAPAASRLCPAHCRLGPESVAAVLQGAGLAARAAAEPLNTDGPESAAERGGCATSHGPAHGQDPTVSHTWRRARRAPALPAPAGSAGPALPLLLGSRHSFSLLLSFPVSVIPSSALSPLSLHSSSLLTLLPNHFVKYRVNSAPGLFQINEIIL